MVVSSRHGQIEAASECPPPGVCEKKSSGDSRHLQLLNHKDIEGGREMNVSGRQRRGLVHRDGI